MGQDSSQSSPLAEPQSLLNLDIWGKTLPGKSETDPKSYYPLLGHMLDTVATASILYERWLRAGLRGYFADQFGDESTAKSMVVLAAGLHDLGKCSPIFQGELLGARQTFPHANQVEKLKLSGLSFPPLDDIGLSTARKEKLNRHEKIGYWLTTDRQRDINSTIGSNWIQTAILGHHGQFAISYGIPRSSNQIQLLDGWHTESWLQQVSLHGQAVEKAAGITLEEACRRTISHEAVILISGLIVLADRLASNDRAVTDSATQMSLGEIDLRDPASYVAKRSEFLEKLCEVEIGFPLDLKENGILGTFMPRGVQKQIPESNGMWTVMAPTGAGKTEAALLRHSLQKENLIFLLPTKSTTDAMFDRLRKIYRSVDGVKLATLAHGDAYLNSFYQQSRGFNIEGHDDSCGSHLIPSGLTNAGARLSSPISVATIDQMVMGGLPMKWSHLRLLTLANSHIIMDEAHLLDSYQITLIEELISFLGSVGTRITVLSATMPSALKAKLASAYEGKDVKTTSSFPSEELFPLGVERAIPIDSYRASVKMSRGEPFGSHVQWAIDSIERYPKSRIGIFVNTVNSAQALADILSERLPDVRVICLHSRMLAAHRKMVVDDLVRELGTKDGSTERVILVGTQVIEMSLDIDLDLISTDICPAPSLIQRMGRAWRDKSPDGEKKRYGRIAKADFPRMEVHIAIAPDDADNRNPYLPYSKSLIKRALGFLESMEELRFPEDIQSFVETSSIDYSSIVGSFAEQEEIAQDILAQMKANSVRSRIGDFRSPYAEVKSASSLTESELDEELLTRLIDGDTLPLVFMSDDAELQKLGALPVGTDPQKISERDLKLASIGISKKIQRTLIASGMEPLSLGKRTFGFFGEPPGSITYDPLIGLIERS